MAALLKATQLSRHVNNVTKLFTNLSLTANVNPSPAPTHIRRILEPRCALFHTTPKRNGLNEFFEEEKNWGKTTIRVGRSWKTEELRLKSNVDLHKLWYVLLKERNMLLTMEHACKEHNEIFPNPERLDKVEDSMCNLEQVVRERNRAYHLLETGESGERPAKTTYNAIGMRFFYKMRQYPVPKFMNPWWHKHHMFGYGGYAVHKFLRLYREKIWNSKRREQNRAANRVATLLRMYPNLDMEAVKEQFPTVDIEKVKRQVKVRAHAVPQ